MKIYEIGTGYTPIPAQMGAATEIIVEELTTSFMKMGEDVEIIDIAADCRAENSLPITEVKVPSAFRKNDVSLGIVHKLKRVVYSVKLASKLKKILKKTDEKVVLHFHNQYNMFFFLKLSSKKLRKKALLAYTVHSYIWGTQWEKIEGTIKKKYFQEVSCVQNADMVLVLNDITTDHFVKHLSVDKNRIVKVNNGVNIDKYSPLSKEKIEEIKKSMKLQDKKIIFQVGSVCDRKNQLGSVRMLCDYLKSHKDVIYMYAGGIIDSEYKNSIDSLAADNNISEQVIYAGELAPGKQLNEYYNIADCSVFTSNLEAFGLVIIEAISSGTPVVLSNNLMFNLSSGYNIYHSDEEFVSLVDKVLGGEKSISSDNKDVLDTFSWDTVAKDYLEKFKSAI
ncbi:MAG: glycosyltransferase family 4 protein [Ruminococcaceae bacterium]|nr:glycosyltransferase family 4 protein [Oscillospiraceae bacterium]